MRTTALLPLVFGAMVIMSATSNAEAPTAVATTTSVTTAGGTLYSFTVRYDDDGEIDVSSLGNNDVRVTGPGGFDVAAAFVGVNLNYNGTPRFATYSLVPPGGSWDSADNGTYNVVMQANAVFDGIGNPVAAGNIGSFTVMTPSSTPTPTPSSAKALNLSTRLDVETGDNVAIGGFFVIGGAAPKTVAIRAVGPSLANSTPPVAGSLPDPVLDLHEPDGTIVTNDNWQDNDSTSQGIITANGLNMYNGAVIDDKEAIIIAALSPNGTAGYTAVLRGQNNVTGIGLVEVYDLDDPTLPAALANISTRGLVGTDANVLIGGVIVGPAGSSNATLVVRAIGPSLGNASPPVANALADPVLELHNGSGDLVTMNDNWQDGADSAEIDADGLAPSDPRESALLANLPTGNYTAIVLGQNSTTGVGLVEVYRLP